MGRTIIFLVQVALFLSCDGYRSALPNDFRYDLKDPDEVYELPPYLKEVSGIDVLNENLIAMVDDNKGSIFIFDASRGEVVKEIEVTSADDFEGIALVNNEYFIIKSDGDIYSFLNGEVNEYETPLREENDIEGLAYDQKNERLLIALKGEPARSEVSTDKEIYAFDLLSKRFVEKPVITISLEQFEEFAKKEILNFPFKPSGISVHPENQDYYLISSTADVLVRFSSSGELKGMAWLEEMLLEQPEGIDFSKSGNMYLSSEGKSYPPRLVKFKEKG